MSGPVKECPHCGADISDSWEDDDPDTGITGGYYCEECDEAIEDDRDDSTDADFEP